MADSATQRYYSAPCPGCGAPVEFKSAQSIYAVTASRERQGPRECTTFRWYRSGEVIRVDCRTVFGTATPAGGR